ncbi:MAG TPA: hypothetical protein VEM57_06180, partial [Candidatus Binatus sp.]|nr:hypothetical protein [Candidatus Binatus sp.]
PLDLFRFEDATANDPASVADFGSFPRSQEPGVEAIFDDIAAEARMSTGYVTGDGRQASHWKDDGLTGVFVGIMDPTLPSGTVETVGPADLRALDLIGYDIGGVGTTTTTTATTTTSTTTIPLLCAPTPATGCREAAPGGAQLSIRDDATNARDQFKWSWSRGAATDVTDFKDPVSGGASYEVCVYDASGNAQPLMASRLLPGGTCGTRPCWKVVGTSGFAYANNLGTPQGLTKGKLRAGPLGKAQVRFQGKGVNLPTPAPPLALPVTVQLLIDDGTTTACWQTVYGAALVNGSGTLKAKGP